MAYTECMKISTAKNIDVIKPKIGMFITQFYINQHFNGHLEWRSF